jgi:hypothetical protein
MDINGLRGGGTIPTAAGSPVSSSSVDTFELMREGVDRSTSAESQRFGVDLNQYLDVQVTNAARHLEGVLSHTQLALVKESLLEQAASDPVVIELVRRVTGKSPQAA